MGFADYYLQKYAYTGQLIQEKPDDVSIILVIPCYKESELLLSLQSIKECELPDKAVVEVIIVVNSSDHDNDEVLAINSKTFFEAENWIKEYSAYRLRFYLLHVKDIPEKHAGVGLARKIGMDEAVRRFNGCNNNKGIIAGFDADAVCNQNYLIEIEKHFRQYPRTVGCSFYFEHPLSGDKYSEDNYKAIVLYELYLRYYIEALRFSGFPYAYHTLGSSFAVGVEAYIKQGGMNRRKAGEDFYFLHKIIPLGNYYEINSTCIYPSPRSSDRVPFGTGAAIEKIVKNKDTLYPAFHPDAFNDLKIFFNHIGILYQISTSQMETWLKKNPESISRYLMQTDFYNAVENVNRNSAGKTAFIKRFFNWFNGLQVLQFLNYSHESVFNKIPVEAATRDLLQKGGKTDIPYTEIDILMMMRNIQKKNYFPLTSI